MLSSVPPRTVSPSPSRCSVFYLGSPVGGLLCYSRHAYFLRLLLLKSALYFGVLVFSFTGSVLSFLDLVCLPVPKSLLSLVLMCPVRGLSAGHEPACFPPLTVVSFLSGFSGCASCSVFPRCVMLSFSSLLVGGEIVLAWVLPRWSSLSSKRLMYPVVLAFLLLGLVSLSSLRCVLSSSDSRRLGIFRIISLSGGRFDGDGFLGGIFLLRLGSSVHADVDFYYFVVFWLVQRRTGRCIP